MPQKTSRKKDGSRDSTRTRIENKSVELFANMARTLGQPPSHGSIYGMLFISPKPLSMSDLIKRLKISKGSASQGLRQLKAFGIIQSTGKNGDRREYYTAETELKRLGAALLQERFLPKLEAAAEDLKQLKKLSKKSTASFRLIADKRIDKLATWHTKAFETFPFILKFLQD